MGRKKRDYILFLACWMDAELVKSDICVEMPVGWLDDRKKSGHSFRKHPIGSLDGSKKRDYILFLACWMDSELVKSDICVEMPVGWLDGSKKTGVCFFFGLLDGWMT